MSQEIQQIQLNLELFYRLTPSSQKIAIALFDITQCRFFNDEELTIKPKGKTLAKKAKCGVRTVENFNKLFRTSSNHKNTISIIRSSKYGKRHLNLYKLDKYFLMALFLLKLSGCLHDRYKQSEFITQFSENQHDMIQRLVFTNTRLRHEEPQKYGTITTLFNYLLEEYKVPTKEVPAKKEIREMALQDLKIVEFNMSEIKINTQQRRYFLSNFPLGVLMNSLNDLKFYKQKGNIPKSEFGVFYNRVKYHNLNRRNYAA